MLITQKIDRRNHLLDVMRGVAVIGLLLLRFPGNSSYVYPFLQYAEGNMFTDMVYSFFLFAIGISMFYSFSKYEFSWSKRIALKIGKRAVILFTLGVLLNLLDMVNRVNPAFAVMGDLQYVAVTYGLASLLVLWLKRLRFLIGAISVLVVAYCVLLFVWPLLSAPSGEMSVMWRVLSYLVSTLAGYITVVVGLSFASRLLLALGLFIVGLSCFLIGSVYEHTVPLSTTFVFKLVSYSWICYACLIFVIEVCKWRKWTYPFTHIGENALFIYVLSAVIAALSGWIIVWTTPAGGTTGMSGWFYKNVCAALFGNNEAGSLCYTFVCILLVWLVAWRLYRRKIFIKV